MFALSDTACATSSVRLRTWSRGGHQVHHLIDPRTQFSGGDGLASVTVLHDDPARAEVWSKSLFLSGETGIHALASSRGLAAAWVTAGGALHINAAAAAFTIWESAGV